MLNSTFSIFYHCVLSIEVEWLYCLKKEMINLKAKDENGENLSLTNRVLLTYAVRAYVSKLL